MPAFASTRAALACRLSSLLSSLCQGDDGLNLMPFRQAEERTEAYVKAYDVVILGDCGFDFVLSLLRDVASKTAN